MKPDAVRTSVTVLTFASLKFQLDVTIGMEWLAFLAVLPANKHHAVLAHKKKQCDHLQSQENKELQRLIQGFVSLCTHMGAPGLLIKPTSCGIKENVPYSVSTFRKCYLCVRKTFSCDIV